MRSYSTTYYSPISLVTEYNVSINRDTIAEPANMVLTRAYQLSDEREIYLSGYLLVYFSLRMITIMVIVMETAC